MIRIGDVVRHEPTGEQWVVAALDREDMYWVGWPPGCARLADCTLVEACTDAEHVDMVQVVRDIRSEGYDRRAALLLGVRGAPVSPNPSAPWLLQYALAHGLPPELASALVTHATPPLPPATDALLRSLAALQAEAREASGTGDTQRQAAAEMASMGLVQVVLFWWRTGGGR